MSFIEFLLENGISNKHAEIYRKRHTSSMPKGIANAVRVQLSTANILQDYVPLTNEDYDSSDFFFTLGDLWVVIDQSGTDIKVYKTEAGLRQTGPMEKPVKLKSVKELIKYYVGNRS